jgi:tRNA threonylcarbamoyladenosine biosynthesis protein TsaB
VRDGRRTLAAAREVMRKGHAERIVPMVQQVMAEGGLGWDDLDLIAVTTGPGSFTGVRVGLAAARGFALAARRPLAGVTVMEALAEAVPPRRLAGRPLVVALDARRGELYLQRFDAGRRAIDRPRLVDRMSLVVPAAPCLVIGDGAAAFDGPPGIEADPTPLLPDARRVAALAARRHGRGGEPLPDRMPAPLYLRDADARRPEDVAPVHLGRAGPHDAAMLAALHARCFDEPWSADFIARLLEGKGGIAIVARLREGDLPVGFALLRTVADEAELLSLGVVPERRREGIAQRLVAACFDRCRIAGVRRLHLEVAEDNRAARTLYARASFLPAGRRKGYYDGRAGGRAADALTLARELP